MPRRHVIDATASSRARPGAVYRLLVDGASWPTWSQLGSFELERPGAEPTARGESVGAIRVFRTGRVESREEVVEAVPDRRFSYVLLSGLPLRGYRADVDVEPSGEGSAIRWRSSFSAKIPGTGSLYAWMLGRFIRQIVRDLAEHAASPAAAPAASPALTDT